MPQPTTAEIPICSCGSFLLYLFYFRGKRFLCLRCGALYAGAPRTQPSTPEGEARLAAFESEFLTNCGSKLFAFGIYLRGCGRCDRDEEHIRHASRRDWVELNDALKWLSDRTGREFGLVNGDLGHYAELMSVATSATSPSGFEEILGGGI